MWTNPPKKNQAGVRPLPSHHPGNACILRAFCHETPLLLPSQIAAHCHNILLGVTKLRLSTFTKSLSLDFVSFPLGLFFLTAVFQLCSLPRSSQMCYGDTLIKYMIWGFPAWGVSKTDFWFLRYVFINLNLYQCIAMIIWTNLLLKS